MNKKLVVVALASALVSTFAYAGGNGFTGKMENALFIPNLLKTYRRLFECLML